MMKAAILLGFIIAILISCDPPSMVYCVEPQTDTILNIDNHEPLNPIDHLTNFKAKQNYLSINLSDCFDQVNTFNHPMQLLDQESRTALATLEKHKIDNIVFIANNGKPYRITRSKGILNVYSEGKTIARIRKRKGEYWIEIESSAAKQDLPLAGLSFKLNNGSNLEKKHHDSLFLI